MDDLTNADERKTEDAKVDVQLSAEARVMAAQAKQQHPSPDPPAAAMQKPVNSPAFLMSWVKWHPAIGTFQFLADCATSSDDPPYVRFNTARDMWPKFYWLCVIVDFLVMVAILVGLGVVACRVIVMTLFS
ncbi:hypothetical protein [Corynebacterium riegelii]|uniref:Uncharacterized protein n=1 Tax=Corynebacterium riegelii TaxID=156976 RepID=A0A0K1RBW5_9CORY|nr:hypothetical protein [Corynebacterium riegelii]AKV58888.1 hypothetical protein AK829_06590 [Corynebacterium riegelii]